MKKLLVALFIFAAVSAFAQQPQKYALVIGNSNYNGIPSLRNPANDANDMEAALKGLGFTVDKVLNGSLEQMENAVLNLQRRLGGSRNTYGFFFYAGHGVQSSGENYLIPVAADNIRTETQLRERAVSLQFVLESMGEAGNELNMVVLDACRDNPFGWSSRGGGGRGLSVISRAPTGSIVMYATGANSTANDGTGRNGLFTSHLLNNIKKPGLSVFEVFEKTMGDVINVTNGGQHPELSLRYAAASSAYLGSRPAPAAIPAAATAAVALVPIPMNVRAGQPGNDRVTLHWDGSGSGSYKVYYNTRNDPSGANVFGEPTDATSVVVDGLDNGAQYFFWVTSLQNGVESIRSPVLSIRTPAIITPKKPSPQPSTPGKKQGASSREERLNTVGASLGTSFPAPGFVGTVSGTVTPWKRSFFDVGMDIGLGNWGVDVRHFSLYPHARYAFLVPFDKSGGNAGSGWYIGAGAGCMIITNTFPEGSIHRNLFAADISTGIRFAFGMTISNSLRTDFKGISNKIAVGYSYHFK